MSFLVEWRHWMLKRAITPQVGEESFVRDHGLVSAFGYHGKIVQILEELFVVADWKDHGGSITVLVSEVLQGLAHGVEATLWRRESREREQRLTTTHALDSCHTD